MSTESTLRIGSPVISPAEQTPLVLALAEIVERQAGEIEALRDEIHKLKGSTQRPKIEPSRTLKPQRRKSDGADGKRPGSAKRNETEALPIQYGIDISAGQSNAMLLEGHDAFHAEKVAFFFGRCARRQERHSLNEEMLLSLERLGAPQVLRDRIASLDEAVYLGRETFAKQLDRWRIRSAAHRTLVCEAGR